MVDNKVINYVQELINRLNITDYIGILVYGSYVVNCDGCGKYLQLL